MERKIELTLEAEFDEGHLLVAVYNPYDRSREELPRVMLYRADTIANSITRVVVQAISEDGVVLGNATKESFDLSVNVLGSKNLESEYWPNYEAHYPAGFLLTIVPTRARTMAANASTKLSQALRINRERIKTKEVEKHAAVEGSGVEKQVGIVTVDRVKQDEQHRQQFALGERGATMTREEKFKAREERSERWFKERHKHLGRGGHLDFEFIKDYLKEAYRAGYEDGRREPSEDC